MAGVVMVVVVAVMPLLRHGPAHHRVGRGLEGLHRNLCTTKEGEQRTVIVERSIGSAQTGIDIKASGI